MGEKLGFAIAYGLVWVLSRLPFGVWYRISDLLFGLLYGLVRYRRAVVQDNLRRSFPDWDAATLRRMTWQFYRHFCDLLVETAKGLTLSDRQLARRVTLLNPEVVTQIAEGGRGCILLASHYGNHEWMMARMDLEMAGRVPAYAIYSPFRPAFFDRLMRKLRERRGIKMLPMQRAMIQTLRHLRQPCLIGFITDQSPNRGQSRFYIRFLDQVTAVHTSLARIALRAEAPVYYADMRKLRRGHYSLRLLYMGTEDFLPESEANIYRFTEHLNAPLEAAIRAQPPYWLWSHRRWKHPPRPEDTLAPDLLAPRTGETAAER